MLVLLVGARTLSLVMIVGHWQIVQQFLLLQIAITSIVEDIVLIELIMMIHLPSVGIMSEPILSRSNSQCFSGRMFALVVRYKHPHNTSRSIADEIDHSQPNYSRLLVIAEQEDVILVSDMR